MIETVLTDDNGNYHFDASEIVNGNTYRIEFSDLPEGIIPSFTGEGNASDIQFVDVISCDINYGVVNPYDYCGEDPQLLTYCYVRGDLSSTSGDASLISLFNSNATNVGNEDDAFIQDHNVAVPNDQLGSCWGLAYDRYLNQIYVGSNIKTQTELGPGGIGAIYAVDNSVNTGLNTVTSADMWLDLTTVTGINLGPNPFDTCLLYTSPSPRDRQKSRMPSSA